MSNKIRLNNLIKIDPQKPIVCFLNTLLSEKIKRAVLISGPKGSGKTTILKFLEDKNPSTKFSYIHLNEDIDSKMLLGTFVCSKNPGEFEFQPGPLSRSAEEGNWLVLENVDSASFDVIASLTPFVKENYFLLNGRKIEINSNFKIIATSILDINENEGNFKSSKLLQNLFYPINIPSLEKKDIELISKTSFPLIGKFNLFDHLFDAFLITKQKKNIKNFDFDDHSSLTIRNFLKCCARIESLVGNLYQGNSLVFKVKQIIVNEIYECFLGGYKDETIKKLVLKEIIKIFNLDEDTIKKIINGEINQVKFPFKNFAETSHAKRLFSIIKKCVEFNEPVLLMGETGVGKTSIIQNFADISGKKLVIQNLHQQTESTDLVGGFKPNALKGKCMKLILSCELLVTKSKISQSQKETIKLLKKECKNRNYAKTIKHFISIGNAAKNEIQKDLLISGKNWEGWKEFIKEVLLFRKILIDLHDAETKREFSFVLGNLTQAAKNGDWILLDELNLASPAVSERVSSLLQQRDLGKSTFHLLEKGDGTEMKINPEFRLFACINPPTGPGKKHLPSSIREKFTEVNVPDMTDKKDIYAIIRYFLDKIQRKFSPKIDLEKMSVIISEFYILAKSMAENEIKTPSGEKPRYSIRSLARAMRLFSKNLELYSFNRALYDGFSVNFLSSLDSNSERILNEVLRKIFLETNEFKMDKSESRRIIKDDKYVMVEGFYFKKGPFYESEMVKDFDRKEFVLTKTIQKRLKKLARIVSSVNNGVILEGITSCGKTSLVKYLARLTGNKYVRINNHEHTDLQEYVGQYTSSPEGNFVFVEGSLVTAVRKGAWVVLDELNLAPSEVLEALNRLLDDNKEIYVPETGETVKAHENFRLFATQNPVGLYGGRKSLSWAFRNRFVEMYVEEIPRDELSFILQRRYDLPKSFSDSIVATMKDLQIRSHYSEIFLPHSNTITPRNIFRWAKRNLKTYQELAEHGYMLLAEKFSSSEEKLEIKKVIEKHMKSAVIDENLIYSDLRKMAFNKDALCKKAIETKTGVKSLTWTKGMLRLFHLVLSCVDNKEPILLVGGPGSSKTTVCQVVAVFKSQTLRVLNCNQNTEAMDFIGGIRPSRNRKEIEKILLAKMADFLRINEEIARNERVDRNSSVHTIFKDCYNLYQILKKRSKEELSETDFSENEQRIKNIKTLYFKLCKPFEWKDGVLITAMKQGDFLLFDEISLADHSVMERLNSVLEDERTLFVPEINLETEREIKAHSSFALAATMNPPGDYGKKNLTNSFRNRFTEVFVPSLIDDLESIKEIISERLNFKNKLNLQSFKVAQKVLAEFVLWFNDFQKYKKMSLRAILSWCDFIAASNEKDHSSINFIIEEGFLLVSNSFCDQKSKNRAITKLRDIISSQSTLKIKIKTENEMDFTKYKNLNLEKFVKNGKFDEKGEEIGIGPYFINKGENNILSFENAGFFVASSSVYNSIFSLFRAMQLQKAILLEGSPGSGKTSTVMAIAQLTGHKIVRVNLNEHTDIMDLLGSDLPAQETQVFQWSDGVLLNALKNGHWVLLDELNLASQSVLEGLNSLLDHRESVFIPELNETFRRPAGFRIFACQNPESQGGGRKGLPQSFLNRFLKVHIGEMGIEDLVKILSSKFYMLDEKDVTKLSRFNSELVDSLSSLSPQKDFAVLGSPWEFNLRDLSRVCSLISFKNHQIKKVFCKNERNENKQFVAKIKDEMKTTINENLLKSAIDKIYCQRLRHPNDKKVVAKCFEKIFGMKLRQIDGNHLVNSRKFLFCGNSVIKKSLNQPLNKKMAEFGEKKTLELLIECIYFNWPVIMVGPHASKKTTIVKSLTKALGKELEIVHINPEDDSSELLGNFEQKNSKSDDLKEEKGKAEMGCSFEWVDSPLVRAVEKGKWILLENVNFCNPSVFDRLNSLFEPNGYLVVNESGTSNGKARRIKPHGDFRVFMTVDPLYGEVSRAMRNRCVEVFLNESEDNQYFEYNGVKGEFDFKKFLGSGKKICSLGEKNKQLKRDILKLENKYNIAEKNQNQNQKNKNNSANLKSKEKELFGWQNKFYFVLKNVINKRFVNLKTNESSFFLISVLLSICFENSSLGEWRKMPLKETTKIVLSMEKELKLKNCGMINIAKKIKFLVNIVQSNLIKLPFLFFSKDEKIDWENYNELPINVNLSDNMVQTKPNKNTFNDQVIKTETIKSRNVFLIQNIMAGNISPLDLNNEIVRVTHEVILNLFFNPKWPQVCPNFRFDFYFEAAVYVQLLSMIVSNTNIIVTEGAKGTEMLLSESKTKEFSLWINFCKRINKFLGKIQIEKGTGKELDSLLSFISFVEKGFLSKLYCYIENKFSVVIKRTNFKEIFDCSNRFYGPNFVRKKFIFSGKRKESELFDGLELNKQDMYSEFWYVGNELNGQIVEFIVSELKNGKERCQNLENYKGVFNMSTKRDDIDKIKTSLILNRKEFLQFIYPLQTGGVTASELCEDELFDDEEIDFSKKSMKLSEKWEALFKELSRSEFNYKMDKIFKLFLTLLEVVRGCNSGDKEIRKEFLQIFEKHFVLFPFKKLVREIISLVKTHFIGLEILFSIVDLDLVLGEIVEGDRIWRNKNSKYCVNFCRLELNLIDFLVIIKETKENKKNNIFELREKIRKEIKVTGNNLPFFKILTKKLATMNTSCLSKDILQNAEDIFDSLSQSESMSSLKIRNLLFRLSNFKNLIFSNCNKNLEAIDIVEKALKKILKNDFDENKNKDKNFELLCGLANVLLVLPQSKYDWKKVFEVKKDCYEKILAKTDEELEIRREIVTNFPFFGMDQNIEDCLGHFKTKIEKKKSKYQTNRDSNFNRITNRDYCQLYEESKKIYSILLPLIKFLEEINLNDTGNMDQQIIENKFETKFKNFIPNSFSLNFGKIERNLDEFENSLKEKCGEERSEFIYRIILFLNLLKDTFPKEKIIEKSLEIKNSLYPLMHISEPFKLLSNECASTNNEYKSIISHAISNCLHMRRYKENNLAELNGDLVGAFKILIKFSRFYEEKTLVECNDSRKEFEFKTEYELQKEEEKILFPFTNSSMDEKDAKGEIEKEVDDAFIKEKIFAAVQILISNCAGEKKLRKKTKIAENQNYAKSASDLFFSFEKLKCFPHLGKTEGSYFLQEEYLLFRRIFGSQNTECVDLDEKKAIFTPLKNYSSKLRWLIEMFPNNSILLTLAIYCDKIFNLSIEITPLSSFCSLVENLMKKSQEWESTTSKRYSIEKEMKTIIKVLSKWRKKELVYWEELLETKENEMVMKTLSEVFHVYSLVENSSGIENQIKILREIEMYLLQSQMGRYKTRLEIICFISQENLVGEEFSKGLKNLYRIYKQKESIINAELMELKLKLSSEIRDLKKLISWDERSYWRFIDTLSRYRPKVCEIIRKWRAKLEEKVDEVFDRKQSSLVIDFKNKEVKQLYKEPFVDYFSLNTNMNSKRKLFLKSTDEKTVSFQKDKSKSKIVPNAFIITHEKCKKLCKRWIDCFTKLRSKQKGKTQEKRRILLILLERLCRINKGAEEVNAASDEEKRVKKLLEFSYRSFDKEFLCEKFKKDNFETLESLENSNFYFYENFAKLEFLNKIYERGGSTTLNRKEKYTMMKQSEKLFSFLITQRRSLSELFDLAKSIMVFKNILEDLKLFKTNNKLNANSKIFYKTVSLRKLKELEMALFGLDKQFEFHSEFLRNENFVFSFSGENEENGNKRNEDGENGSRNGCFLENLEKNKATVKGVIVLLKEAFGFCENHEGLFDITKNGLKFQTVFDGLFDLKNELISFRKFKKQDPLMELNFGGLFKCVENVISLIENGFTIIEYIKDTNLNFEEENEFIKGVNEFKKTLAGLEKSIEGEKPMSMNKITTEMRKIVDLDLFKTKKDIYSGFARCFFYKNHPNTSLLPFDQNKTITYFDSEFKNLYRRIRNIINSFSKCYERFNKIEFVILSMFSFLMEIGFEEEEEEIIEKNGKEITGIKGIGMSEGKGEKDVTKELENEEQILGLKNEKEDVSEQEKDDAKPEIDNESGAIIEEDFNGDMFDFEREENEDPWDSDGIPDDLLENSEDFSDQDEQREGTIKDFAKKLEEEEENLQKLNQKTGKGDIQEEDQDPSDASNMNQNEEISEKEKQKTSLKKETNFDPNDEFLDADSEKGSNMISKENSEFEKNSDSDSELDKIGPKPNEDSNNVSDENELEDERETEVSDQTFSEKSDSEIEMKEDEKGPYEYEQLKQDEKSDEHENTDLHNRQNDDRTNQNDQNDQNSQKEANNESQNENGTHSESNRKTFLGSNFENNDDFDIDADVENSGNESEMKFTPNMAKRMKIEKGFFNENDNESNSEEDMTLALRKSHEKRTERKKKYSDKYSSSVAENSAKMLKLDNESLEDTKRQNDLNNKFNKFEKNESEILDQKIPFENTNLEIEQQKSGIERQNLNEKENLDEIKSNRTLSKVKEKKENDQLNLESSDKTKTILREKDEKQNNLELWEKLSAETSEITALLNQSLSRTLTPNVANRLQGDYRTGKRINMRRAVQYVASSYRMDKIWLRRTRLAKRHYQVVVGIDNSESMKDRRCTDSALKALVTVSNALKKLEVGEIAVAKMGSETKILHEFGKPFSSEIGAKCLSQFDFGESSTRWIDFLEKMGSYLKKARFESSFKKDFDTLQLVLVISDGSVQEDREKVSSLVMKAIKEGQLIVAVLLDSSLPEHTLVEFSGDEVIKTPLLEKYPLPYYLVLRNVEELPNALAEALKKWFEMGSRGEFL